MADHEPPDAFSAVLDQRMNEIQRSLNRIESQLVTKDAFNALDARVTGLERTTVSRIEHLGLVQDVADNKAIAIDGIDRNDKRWDRIGWYVGLFLVAAVLTALLGTGAIRP